jgi:hypothetical protein
MVQAEFNIEASELITAPQMAANIKPLSPMGIRLLINIG